MMLDWLQSQLSSRNGFVRKGAAAALQVPKWLRLRHHVSDDDYRQAPPILANSFPKSGTHLMFQIVDGLPNATPYGAFLSSMTSSFQFRERSPENAGRFIRGFAPGEIVRGHLFFDPRNALDLRDRNVVHYFVYRDPRDVVLSEVHYLRGMNRWHHLHRYFARTKSMEDAITLAITGLDPPVHGTDYPDIAMRFNRYKGWLLHDDCLAIRFEDLVSENQFTVIEKMVEFYADHCSRELDIAACVEAMSASIAPDKSHTFRRGKKAGWREEFTEKHRRLFDRIAGNLLIELGYESDHSWVETPRAHVTLPTPHRPA